MAIYIKGMGNISPQQSWGDEPLLSAPRHYTGSRARCVEPDYTQFIDPRQLRRMSRIIKMGYTAGTLALKEAGIAVSDGIITGTGFGCLEDTGTFLDKMIENKEYALNPTPFIQSTHNTIGSQIALMLQCQGYNQTYTQGAFSFENSLLDALMDLKENPAQHLLVGAADEVTDVSHAIQQRFGTYQGEEGNSLNILASDAGTVNGEGAAYFVLSGEKGEHDKARLDGVATYYKPSAEELKINIQNFLTTASLTLADIDLVLIGKSGHASSDAVAANIADTVFANTAQGSFKHLCGEYPCATTFAVWLGARMLEQQHVPAIVGNYAKEKPLRRVLVYNSFLGKNHSLILLSHAKV